MAGVKHAVAGVALLLAGEAAGADSLDIGGTVYPSSCEADAWEALAAEIRGAAGKREPQRLVALVQAYLCGGDGRAAEIVLRASPARVLEVSEGTGEPTTRRRVSSRQALQPRGGKAWNASVHAETNDVSVSFFINEACVRSITFRMAKPGWRTHAVGEACD